MSEQQWRGQGILRCSTPGLVSRSVEERFTAGRCTVHGKLIAKTIHIWRAVEDNEVVFNSKDKFVDAGKRWRENYCEC